MNANNYRRNEIQDVIDAGTYADGWFRLQVAGVHASKHLNVTFGQLEAIRDILFAADNPSIDDDDDDAMNMAYGSLDETDIPSDFPVKVTDGSGPHDATCGTCGLSWDDSIATGMTPAPSARCPFEYFHRH
jgi:hypothetical protein